MRRRVVLVSVACLALFFSVPANSAEGEHGEGTTSQSAESCETKSPQSLCELHQQALYSKLENEVYEEYNISINCLQFNGEAELESAIVSVFGESEERRDVIECRGGALVTSPSPQPPDRFDIRDSNYTGCLTCNDNTTGTDICDEPCDGICERCYNQANSCTRCTACISPSSEECDKPMDSTMVCREECGENQEPSRTLYNTCECQQGYYKLIEFASGPGPHPSFSDQERVFEGRTCSASAPEEPRQFTCTKDCTRNGDFENFRSNNASNICFACGLEDCFLCENPEHPECIQCIADSLLFEEECFSCPRRDIAFQALEQEHEEEEEEEVKRKIGINLAISLPIVCVAVIVFFVLMSVFAHYRYPHISHRGHKRHRKPAELPPDGSDDEEERDRIQQLDSSQVWRARPTIRLR